jgi:hypothetical protein
MPTPHMIQRGLSSTAADARRSPPSSTIPVAPPAHLHALQRLGRAVVEVAGVLALTLPLAQPLPAYALLKSPNSQIPRTVDAALRRSIPAFNQDVRGIQMELEVGG